MSRKQRSIVAMIAGGVTLALLVWLTVGGSPGPFMPLTWLFFSLFVTFAMTFGVPIGGGQASLLPMALVAACLVTGPVWAGWAAFAGAAAHGLIRYRWAERLELQVERNALALLGLVAANATMLPLSIIAGGEVYRLLGGDIPLAEVSYLQAPQLVLLGATYLSVNYVLAGLFILMRGRAALRVYLRSLPSLLLYEGAPIVLAPLMALIYTDLRIGQFLIFTLLLVAFSLLTRSLDRASRRLERRVQELNSLQGVSQALSASLDLETILAAIHAQVSRLMPANNFFVALYDPETDEVSFPLVIEGGERKRWRSRRMSNGLTEHILRTRAPLLIRRDVGAALERLGLAQIGESAASWVGVPILAGDEPLGVIAVQSYAAPDAYDSSHQEVLTTIAAQAAVAIQNARLYARTDQALARRVQELDSILRTTREAILLLDTDGRVLAANRALADWAGVPQSQWIGQPLDAPADSSGQPLAALIGYPSADLSADCQALMQEGAAMRRREVVFAGPPERHAECALTPVHDRQGAIAGWLLVFRDLTEERELTRMREEMTHMLVHDLRSPLSALIGSLDLIEIGLTGRGMHDLDDLIKLARRSTDRMLRMVNDLLDIGRLESGQMPVRPLPTDVGTLFSEAFSRVSPLATMAQVTVEVEAALGLPRLLVDAELIGRVLNNLLDNAIKFTPGGGTVRLWARLDADHPSEMLIGVSDTGPGIPPEEQPRLFRKFQQAPSISGRRMGSGLGLAFCKLVVEAHGGRIWVESEPGEGSDFIMRLPVVPQS